MISLHFWTKTKSCFPFVSWFIEEALTKQKSDVLSKLLEQLEQFASSHKYALMQKTPAMKVREKKVVTRSFHGAGLVVAVDEHDVGYRELPETDGMMQATDRGVGWVVLPFCILVFFYKELLALL